MVPVSGSLDSHTETVPKEGSARLRPTLPAEWARLVWTYPGSGVAPVSWTVLRHTTIAPGVHAACAGWFGQDGMPADLVAIPTNRAPEPTSYRVPSRSRAHTVKSSESTPDSIALSASLKGSTDRAASVPNKPAVLVLEPVRNGILE